MSNETNIPTKLVELEVELTSLLLDPNNPRFVQKPETAPVVSDKEAASVKIQGEILARFSPKPTDTDSEESDEPDTTNIQDLKISLLRIGYVGIDKIVVRQLGKTGKFLVLEGNRRVAALKSLLKDYDTGAGRHRADFERHKDSFLKITVLELQTTGLTQVEIQKAVSVILGIRHHGSLLPWDPLPRAFNIYTEFTRIAGTDFDEISPSDEKAVAERLCIRLSEVRKALRCYVAYRQLKDEYSDDIGDEDYSVIEELVANKHFRGSLSSHSGPYLSINEKNYELSFPSIERLNRLCQFGRRTSLSPDSLPKRILNDTRDVRRLADIVKRRSGLIRDAEKAFVDNVVQKIEDEGDPLSVEGGAEEIVAYLEAINWKAALKELLDAQKEKLSEDDFGGSSNEIGYIEECQRVLHHLNAIISHKN
jgi:hypothetical protein